MLVSRNYSTNYKNNPSFSGFSVERTVSPALRKMLPDSHAYVVTSTQASEAGNVIRGFLNELEVFFNKLNRDKKTKNLDFSLEVPQKQESFIGKIMSKIMRKPSSNETPVIKISENGTELHSFPVYSLSKNRSNSTLNDTKKHFEQADEQIKYNVMYYVGTIDNPAYNLKDTSKVVDDVIKQFNQTV